MKHIGTMKQMMNHADRRESFLLMDLLNASTTPTRSSPPTVLLSSSIGHSFKYVAQGMMKPRQSDSELPSKSHTISMLFTQLAMEAPSQKIEMATTALEQVDGSED